MEIKKRIEKYDNGNYAEIYHIKGRPFWYHREDGPAVIEYRKDGSIYYEEYWINGGELTKEEWYKKYGWKLQLKGTPMGEIYGN